MEVSELRINNLVQLTNQWFDDNHKLYNTPRIVKVDDISKENLADNVYYVSGYNLSDLEPILLSDEWLVNLGFEKSEDEWGGYLSPAFGKTSRLRVYAEENYFYHSTNLERIKLEYVHQLQNLYFVFAGKELVEK